jgi:quercetin dioxygenase-like cupin family protein
MLKLETVEELETREGLMRPLSINQYVSVIHNTLAPQAKIKPHAHKSNAVFFLLKGQLELVSNSANFMMTPGNVAVIPANTVVGINNLDSSAEILMISAPPGSKSVEELKSKLQAFSKKVE